MADADAEELMRVYDQFNGQAPEGAPPAVQKLFDEISESKSKSSAAEQSAEETETLYPKPEFVVKTADDTGRKVFINICSSEKVQAPESWEDGVMPDSVKQSLNNMEELENSKDVQALRIPLSLSEQRNDYDKHGQECTVFDCVFADKVICEAAKFRPMKVFVIECAMGWIQHKCKVQLDQKFKLPKLKYKGDVIHEHSVRKQQKALVTEVTDITDAADDEPAVALCSRKAVKSVEQISSGGKQPVAAVESEHIRARGNGAQKSAPAGSGVVSASAAQLLDVQYVGKPCQKVVISIRISCKLDKENLQSLVKADMDCIHVNAVDGDPLAVPLNVYVDPSTCTCTLQSKKLTITVSYFSADDIVALAQSCKPLALGAVKLRSQGLLEELD